MLSSNQDSSIKWSDNDNINNSNKMELILEEADDDIHYYDNERPDLVYFYS